MAYMFKHGDRPIEGYTIQRAVGKGGFGEVYYAISDGGREVAIKYLRDNPQVELRGVSHCINLKSPHLVSIFDVKRTADGEYVIIMEYCSGPSLRDMLIAEPSGFEPQKAAFFVREIAKGLSYLHDRGIVHRDLKPGNIFYDDGYVKIGDYGLSKFISVSRHSAQTASVGTVHYMAPEIGSGNYSRGVDIYALGVMLYEMLLGKVPFEGSSMAEVLMKHLTTQPEVDHLPPPFASVIRKALQKDPKDRYATVDEMVEELLEVETVRESLAGFSLQSLEGAVHRGTPARADSPVPSPNPMPGYARDFARPAPATPRQPPYAQPVGAAAALPERLARKMDRISRKIDAKVAKLAGKLAGKKRIPPPPPAARQQGSPAVSPEIAPRIASGDRKKRVLLSGLLSVGLAVGLGVLIGNAQGEEQGVAAGLLVFAMSGGILLSRKAVGWFGVEFGPKWTKRLIQLCCCAPLLAIGAAPLLDVRSDDGTAVFLGLLFCAVFFDLEGKSERVFERGGEISFWHALWAAFVGLICTAIAGAIIGADPEEVMFLSAGVVGVVYIVIQANMWWLSGKKARVYQRFDGGLGTGPQEQEPLPAAPGIADATGEGKTSDEAFPETPLAAAGPASSTAATGAMSTSDPRLRWGITRAFWGLIAFLLMGGTIVTFLDPLVAAQANHHDITVSIILCTSLASFMIFALRKTTPIKRDGFWRETVRPFLISVMLAGIGGTITGIACEWSHWASWNEHHVRCLPDEGRVALIAGLVLCSLMFLGLVLFTGRKRRIPKSFMLASVGGGRGPDPYAQVAEALDEKTEFGQGAPAPEGQAAEFAAPARVSAGRVKAHRGVKVLVLGILGVFFFPLGIAAWVMGNHDLRDMDAGHMDRSGSGLTAAGKICGMVGVLIASLSPIISLLLLGTHF